MFHYSIFRPLRCFPFRQNVKSKLTIEYFVFDLLEIQKIDRLLLKLIHARVAPFGCWLQNSHCSGLHTEPVVQAR